MYKITDEASLRLAISDYIRFYREERPQDRYHCKTPAEIRREAFFYELPGRVCNSCKQTNSKVQRKMVCIEKRPHITCGRSLALHFKYLTCLLDREHINLSSPFIVAKN